MQLALTRRQAECQVITEGIDASAVVQVDRTSEIVTHSTTHSAVASLFIDPFTAS